MHKSVLATAFAIFWLSVSAQISSSKKVLSFGHIEGNEALSIDNRKISTSSFKLVGGLMFVEGSFNGETGSFILDTGAPGLILNNKIPSHELDDSYIASGLTGLADIGELTVSEFKILNIVKSDFTAYQMDLEHIENEILHRFSGLVGSDIFANSILVLDYRNQKWGTIDQIEEKEIETVIPFQLQDHFIILDIKIAGHQYSMILDTGAEINILDAHISYSLKKSKLKNLGSTNIQSASTDHLSTNNVKIQKFHLGKHVEKNQEFSVLPFDFINEGLEVTLDGLIGYPFLEGKKIALDFKSKKLYIYK